MSRIRRAEMAIDEATEGVSCTFITCCVSWEEMLSAVIQFRDKLTEEIAQKQRCPFAPDKSGGIYVASRASVPARGEMWRRFRSEGVPIISSWIDEDGPGQTADMSELWPRVVREVSSSDRLVLYVETDDFPLKGALIEVGVALGCGVPVYVVAPGVELDASYRPIGSWINHPLVKLVATVEEAFR